jgi:hypothetical protein
MHGYICQIRLICYKRHLDIEFEFYVTQYKCTYQIKITSKNSTRCIHHQYINDSTWR